MTIIFINFCNVSVFPHITNNKLNVHVNLSCQRQFSFWNYLHLDLENFFFLNNNKSMQWCYKFQRKLGQKHCQNHANFWVHGYLWANCFFLYLIFVNHGASLNELWGKKKIKKSNIVLWLYLMGKKNKEKQTSYFIALILLEICRIIKGYNFRLGSLVWIYKKLFLYKIPLTNFFHHLSPW